jgi:hypothetical protein
MSAARAAPGVLAPLARNVRLAIVLVLLLATTGAFLVAERVKLQPAPITATHVTKTFGPRCGCATRTARIEFRLRHRDTLTVEIVDAKGDVIRTLLSQGVRPAGIQVFHWNGRDESGALVRQGSYRPRVEFVRAARTITLPNPIRVDLVRPTLVLRFAGPLTISPDGDGHADRVALRYAQSERGQPLLYVNGKLRVRTRSKKPKGTIYWYGTVDGKPVPAGSYRLKLTTHDIAGNPARRPAFVTLHVRYIELAKKVLRVRPRGLVAVGVSTDAKRFHWRLGKRTGTAPAPVLRLRAPAKPGRYALTVAEHGHRAHAVVVVRKSKSKSTSKKP